MNKYFKKISIITPSYNQGKYIRDTILSVLNQDYDNFEHIIIDGGSTDNTVEILKQYKHLKWISEKDRGPVDAIEKGFKMSTGEIVTWLNSDDYFEKNIFGDLLNQFEDEKTKIVVGNMILINTEKEILYINDIKENYNLNYLIRVNSDIIKQPSTFFLKDLFYEVEGFDASLKLVWDYDLFLKMFKVSKPKIINKAYAYQRIYPTTLSRSFSRKQAVEIYKVSKKNGAKIYDKINKLVIIRFIFPSTVSDKPNLIVKSVRYIKKLFKTLKILF